MREKSVDAVVDQVAQALHAAQCVNRVTARHSWIEHRPVAVIVCQMVGLQGVGRRIQVAFKEGFDSRSDQVRRFEEQIKDLQEENNRLRYQPGEEANDRERLVARIADLEHALTYERAATEAARNRVTEAESDLVDERLLRLAAEDRERQAALRLAGCQRALAAAREANGLLQGSRLHVAQALEDGHNTTGGIHA